MEGPQPGTKVHMNLFGIISENYTLLCRFNHVPHDTPRNRLELIWLEFNFHFLFKHWHIEVQVVKDNTLLQGIKPVNKNI